MAALLAGDAMLVLSYGTGTALLCGLALTRTFRSQLPAWLFALFALGTISLGAALLVLQVCGAGPV
jgi:hypothetical protein